MTKANLDPFEAMLNSLETQYRADLSNQSTTSSKYTKFLKKHSKSATPREAPEPVQEPTLAATIASGSILSPGSDENASPALTNMIPLSRSKEVTTTQTRRIGKDGSITTTTTRSTSIVELDNIQSAIGSTSPTNRSLELTKSNLRPPTDAASSSPNQQPRIPLSDLNRNTVSPKSSVAPSVTVVTRRLEFDDDSESELPSAAEDAMPTATTRASTRSPLNPYAATAKGSPIDPEPPLALSYASRESDDDDGGESFSVPTGTPMRLVVAVVDEENNLNHKEAVKKLEVKKKRKVKKQKTINEVETIEEEQLHRMARKAPTPRFPTMRAKSQPAVPVVESVPLINQPRQNESSYYQILFSSTHPLLDESRLSRAPNPEAWLLSVDGAPSTLPTPEKVSLRPSASPEAANPSKSVADSNHSDLFYKLLMAKMGVPSSAAVDESPAKVQAPDPVSSSRSPSIRARSETSMEGSIGAPFAFSRSPQRSSSPSPSAGLMAVSLTPVILHAKSPFNGPLKRHLTRNATNPVPQVPVQAKDIPYPSPSSSRSPSPAPSHRLSAFLRSASPDRSHTIISHAPSRSPSPQKSDSGSSLGGADNWVRGRSPSPGEPEPTQGNLLTTTTSPMLTPTRSRSPAPSPPSSVRWHTVTATSPFKSRQGTPTRPVQPQRDLLLVKAESELLMGHRQGSEYLGKFPPALRRMLSPNMAIPVTTYAPTMRPLRATHEQLLDDAQMVQWAATLDVFAELGFYAKQ